MQQQDHAARRRRWRLFAMFTLVSFVMMCRAEAYGTDVSGECPPGGFTLAGSPWNLIGSITVGASTTCVIEPGVQILGNGNPLIVAAGGMLTAVGTSAEQRDVVLDRTYVQFDGPSGPTPAATGTLENCAFTGFITFAGVYITDASPTVRHCTITDHTGGITIGGGQVLSPAQPLILENAITVRPLSGIPGIDVRGTARPTVTGNTITSDFYGISYAGSAQGTASGNQIFFAGQQQDRAGIWVQEDAAPVIDDNTIFDDPVTAETGIRLTVNAGVAVQVTNNTIHLSTTDDRALTLTPDVFAPGPVISDNIFPQGLGGGIGIGGTSTVSATIGVLEGQSTYQTTGINVAGHLTIAPGITLVGQNSALVVAAGATLTAIGTSTDERDVVLSNLLVLFSEPIPPATPAATGTLENCTITGPAFGGSRAVLIADSSPTVRHCTITNSERGISIGGNLLSSPATPLIHENDIEVPLVGVDVGGTARPTLTGNAITTNLVGINYSGTARGTASGNTLSFPETGGSNRNGIAVQDNAAPTITGNTVNDDPTGGDAGIRVTVNPGTMAQVTNNTIHVSTTSDRILLLAPDVFAPGPTISGNSFPQGVGGGIEVTGTVSSTVVLGILEGQNTYRTAGLAVTGQLTIQPGITLVGENAALVVAPGGMLTAVGTSAEQRDVVLSNILVQFSEPILPATPAGAGTLENCTIAGPAFGGSRAVLIIDASPTLRHCTITNSERGISISGNLQLSPAQPLIEENEIEVPLLGIDVGGTARPTLTRNAITTNSGGINFAGTARGTANGNTIHFVLKGNENRIGFQVLESASPSISTNVVDDDPTRTDTGIFLSVSAGNVVEVIGNSVCATGGDVCIGIDSSQGFEPTAEQIRDNVNPCGGSPCFGSSSSTPTPTITPTELAATPTATPTATQVATATPTSTASGATPTPSPTVTGTPAFLTVNGTCDVPGPNGLEPCPAGIPITASLCDDASCDTLQEVGSATTGDGGTFTVNIADSAAVGARLIVAAQFGEEGDGTGAGTTTTTYRVLTFGGIIGGSLAVHLSPASEAAVQLLEEEGLENYSDGRAMGVKEAVGDANASTPFAGDTIAGAADRARDTASADPTTQARLACPVDCDLDRTTSVAELITAVNRALGHTTGDQCEAADGNGDGTVSIDEMVEGVNGSVGGCFTE